MPCFKPLAAFETPAGVILFRNPTADSVPLRLPCRRCMGCRMTYSSHWIQRGLCELAMHDQADCHFLTATYAPEHMPEHGDLVYSHWQKFARKVRKELGPFRFMVTGEYGEKTDRPHFHAHIYGLRLDDLQVAGRGTQGDTLFESPALEEIWGKGIARIGEINPTTLGYTTGYALKDTGAHDDKNYEIVLPNGEVYQKRRPFMRTSRKPGIGGEWFDRYGITDVFSKGYCTHFGKKYHPPPYFLERLREMDESMYEAEKEKRKEAVNDPAYVKENDWRRRQTKNDNAIHNRWRHSIDRGAVGVDT